MYLGKSPPAQVSIPSTLDGLYQTNYSSPNDTCSSGGIFVEPCSSLASFDLNLRQFLARAEVECNCLDGVDCAKYDTLSVANHARRINLSLPLLASTLLRRHNRPLSGMVFYVDSYSFTYIRESSLVFPLKAFIFLKFSCFSTLVTTSLIPQLGIDLIIEEVARSTPVPADMC